MQTEENWRIQPQQSEKEEENDDEDEEEGFLRTVAIRPSVKGKIFLLPLHIVGSEKCDLLKVIRIVWSSVLCRDDAQYDSLREICELPIKIEKQFYALVESDNNGGEFTQPYATSPIRYRTIGHSYQYDQKMV